MVQTFAKAGRAALLAGAAALPTIGSAAHAQASPTATSRDTRTSVSPDKQASVSPNPTLSTTPDDSKSSELREIVVTASKTGAQRLQTTPIAVSVVNGGLIEQQGLRNIQDIANYVPNLSFSRNIGGSIITLRGIGSNGGGTAVTSQVDGVYIAGSTAFTEYFDLDRVEVLRGPQGTLYGRNATGGTINYISRQPSSTVAGKAQLSYGNFNSLEASGFLSGPVAGDAVRASLAVNYRRHDPYFHNIAPGGHDIGSANTGGGRFQLRLQPAPNLDATTRVDYAEVDQYIESYDHPVARLPINAPLANSLVGSYRDVALNGDQTLRLKDRGISEDINLAVGRRLTLNSITAYRRNTATAFNDNDATELNLLYFRSTTNLKQFSEELNLKYVDSRLRAVAGLYYLDLDSRPGSLVSIPPSLITPPNRSATRGAFPTLKTQSYAAYLQADYAILPALRVIVGGRYTIEKNSFDQNFIATSLNPATPGANLPGFPVIFSVDRKDRAFTPKFGLNYQANENMFFYASATRGFNSGGFNGQATVKTGAGYAPELIWSYEAGAKTQWLDRRLRINLTGFHYDYSNLQVRQLLGPGSSIIANAATAKVEGLELETLGKPFPDLQVTANLSYLNARFKSFPNSSIPGGFAPYVPNQRCVAGVCTIDVSGNFLSDAPKWSFLGALDYSPRVGAYQLRAHIDFSRRSKRYFDVSNIPLSSQGAYSLVNANLGFGPAGSDGWQVALYAKNLTNSKYYQTIAGNGVAPGAIVGDPRTYGFRVGYSW